MSQGVIWIYHPGNEKHPVCNIPHLVCNIPQGRVINIDLRRCTIQVFSPDKIQ
jgi:hypothetical protein